MTYGARDKMLSSPGFVEKMAGSAIGDEQPGVAGLTQLRTDPMSLTRLWYDGAGVLGTSWAVVGYAAIASPIFLSMLVTGSLTRPGLWPPAPTRISARMRTCRAVERPSSIYCSALRTHAVSTSGLVLFATSLLQSGKTSFWVRGAGRRHRPQCSMWPRSRPLEERSRNADAMHVATDLTASRRTESLGYERSQLDARTPWWLMPSGASTENQARMP